MSEIKASSEFEFYQTLRYFLPGLLLVFLFGYIALPEYGDKFSFPEKLAFSILVGFIIHSFGMYKYIPGVIRIRKEYYDKARELLPKIDNEYLRWDIISLSINTQERDYYKKYFALGAFKLDMVFVIIVFLIYYFFSILLSMLDNKIINYLAFVNIFFLLIVILVVRDDGLNDLIRSFNITFLTILKLREKNDFETNILLILNNNELFIKRRRTLLHPVDAIKSIPKWINKKIKWKN